MFWIKVFDISADFAREQKFSGTNSTYSMQGIGGGIIHYRSGVDGYLWNIPLYRNTGKIDWIVGYGVRKILDPVGRSYIPEGEKQFPKMPPAIFEEMPHKRLDLLVGLSDMNE